jgi:two-component system cell cycle sensor histidine kinase/response regulator CckA
VKAHDGAVTVETAPGQGTVFRVFLPLALEQLLEPRKVAPAEPVSVEGRGFVLVAEDDPMLRTLAQTMLKTLGYKSIVAADGVEAVEVFGQRQDQIHCVLLDLTMPRMGGWETLETLREIRPGVRVILASGYDEAHVMGGEHPQLPQTFLQKPYTVDSLKAALAAVPRERQGQE